ncbi:hypothetical protein H8A95_32560 [Bradyrhizobium sp. Pear76]|uniref:hypothetical protein n=1 Tax=Bradyrhizobium oropedii TaxID=1571201 RepID=UPI001E390F90|nr:hypothetical protein [Bradyrhizobium oropedii]MCC8966935.1 hypothetical protein [Bradyrhizobium oropedii]
MRNFDDIAELRALLDRTAIERSAELFVRGDGMPQSGPDAVPAAARNNVVSLKSRAA